MTASNERCDAQTRPELLSWAIERGLEDEVEGDLADFLGLARLSRPASRLLASLYERGFCGSLAELLGGGNRALEFRLASRKNRLLLPEIEGAVRDYLTLCRQVAVKPRAVASPARAKSGKRSARTRAEGEEVARLLALRAKPPSDASLRDFAERLWELWAELREAVAPGGEPLKVDLVWRPEPPTFRASVQDLRSAGRPTVSWWPGSLASVELSLDGWRRALLRPRCDCLSARGEGCAHALALVEELLRLLHENAAGLPASFAETLGQPDWRRALGALERRLASLRQKGEPPERRQLSWRIAPSGNVPRLEPVLQKPLERGGWSPGKTISLSELRDLPDALSQPGDARVLDLLEDAAQATDLRRAEEKRFAALEQLAGHPRLLCERGGSRPWTLRPAPLRVEVVEAGEGALALRPTLGGDPATAELAWRAGGRRYLVEFDDSKAECLIARIPPEAAALLGAFGPLRPTFPPEGHGELLRWLAPLEAALPIELPAALAGERVAADSRPILRLRELPAGGLGLEVRLRPLPGGPLFPPGEGPARLASLVGARRSFAERDLPAEAAAVGATLGGLPLPPAASAPPWFAEIGQLDGALDLLAAVEPRAAAGELSVEWYEPATAWRVTRPASAGDLRVRVEERTDWFGIKGEIEIEGLVAPLAELLDAVRRGGRYVRVAPGRFVALSLELRARLAAAAEVAYPGRSGLEVSPAAAPELDGLFDGAAEAKLPLAWRRLQSRLRAAEGLDPEPPPELAALLRPYQRDGFRWLSRLSAWGVGACLADDMGLGKTLQALAVLSSRAQAGPALVLAPTSVCGNWIREARRFAPSLRPILYREADRERVLGELGPGDLLLASYALLVRDEERFREARFGTLVLDEAQAIKNGATRRARAVRDLQADWRFALTGTPVENQLGELWSLFRILNPGLLGSWEQFRERFANPIERGKDPARRSALARVVRPFVLRRTKAEVAPELPPRTEIQLSVRLSGEERRLYDAARLAAAARMTGLAEGADDPTARFQVLAELTRLRQLACHPKLLDRESRAPSAKLDRLLEIVATLREEGHRALVFSQFVELLSLVREALDARGIHYQYLDGSTPAAERDARVDAFQRGEGDLFLISLRAGGTGLNLTAADYVIHLDPWWNPAVEDQATDRAHRIGQDKPVTVYRLVTQGTVEEAILELHGKKRDLVAGILDGSGAAARLSNRELLALIRSGERAPAEEPDDRAGEEVVAEAVAPPAPVQAAAAPVPASPDLEALARAVLAQCRREGLGKQVVKQYGRVLDRFLAHQAAAPAAPWEERASGYLADLAAGRTDAPRSELTFARTVLRRMARLAPRAGAT